MSQRPIRWLLDAGLPGTAYRAIDAVGVEEFQRVPGPAGIREAVALDRTLVTCNQDFRGPSDLRLDQPISLRGNRFLLRPDRAILLIMPNGAEVDVEPWRHVSLAPMPAVLSGAAS